MQQAVHWWLSTYERLVKSQNFFSSYLTQEDNSRLGRNYPELGRLMEEYFPQMGVRIISVLNHIDSFRDPQGYCSAIVSFSNIMNDDYIRQLSVKIKSTFALKRERG